jgi:uncharacterized membrane protein YhaH (DUF805 family)
MFIIDYFRTVIYVFSNMFNFKGRSGRSEYWQFISFMFFTALVFGVFAGMIEFETSLLIVIIGVIADISLIALTVRRLRDAGFIFWWAIAAFAPIIALPACIIIGLLKTKTQVYNLPHACNY